MKHIRLLSVIILLIGISIIACMKESRFYPESESLKILSNKEGVVEVEAKLSKKANKNFNYITEFGFVVSESPMTIDNDTITSSKNISYYSFIKGNTISKTDTSTNAENEFVFKKSIIGLKLNTNYYIRSFTRVGNNKRSGYSEEELSCILSTTAIVVGFNAPITTTLNQVTFTNTSINADTYEWDFGDNASTTNTSSAKNPTHSFSDFGTYTVTLFAGNSFTTKSISKRIDILKPDLKIGTQFWHANNLNVDHFRDGTPIYQAKSQSEWNNANSAGQPAWCYYNFEPSFGTIYGKLYNWYAVNDSRGLAPIGYHIPTTNEWDNLINYLGGTSVAGPKMKSIDYWTSPNNNTNESGFNGLPGGYCNSGIFHSIEDDGDWWSSTAYNSTSAYHYYLWYNSNYVTKKTDDKSYGFSVRCIKD